MQFLLAQSLLECQKDEEEKEKAAKEAQVKEQKMLQIDDVIAEGLLVSEESQPVWLRWSGEEKEEEEEKKVEELDEASAQLLFVVSLLIPGCLRRGYWFSPHVIVRLAPAVCEISRPSWQLWRRLPSLCAWLPNLELLYRCAAGTQKSSSFRVSGCQCFSCPLLCSSAFLALQVASMGCL